MSCNGQLWRPRGISPLLFFHKIHYGTMSIDKDKYLILFQNLQDLPVCIITEVDQNTLEWASITGMDIKINVFIQINL